SAWHGASYLVVWEDDSAGEWDVLGARVGPSGEILDPSPILISTAPGDQRSPAVAWSGAEYLVVWSDGRCGSDLCRDVYGARVSPAGSVLDPSGIPISTAAQDQFEPKLVWGAGQFLVVWLDARAGLATYAARVTGSGVVLDETGIEISTTADGQGPSVVATDGSDYLVAWVDYGGAPNRAVLAARRGASGGLPDHPPVALSAPPH